ESEEVTEFLLGLFQASDPWESPGGEVTALDLLGRGVTRANDLGEEPLVQARMLDVMAEAHRNLGRFEDEAGLEARVVELLAAERGEEDPAVAEAMVRWGAALSRNGRYDRARVVLARAHEIQEKVLGRGSLELSATLEAQARVDIYLGDLETAEERARESLAIQEEALGPDAAPTLNIYGTLASILRYQGRTTEAEAGFREVLARRRRLAAPDPVALSSDLLQVAGMIIAYGGDQQEAEELSREALALQEPGQGRPTLNRVWALTTLAQLAELRGDASGAERLLREGVSERRRTFGDLHPLVAESLGTLGLYLSGVGRLEEAEAALRESAEINSRTVGTSHTRYAGSLSGLAEVLCDRGKLQEADSLAQEALRIRREAQGPGVVTVAETMRVLAEIRLQRGMYESAESYLLQALEIAEDFPMDAPLPRKIHGQLADLYQAMGRARESARHRTLASAGS
ncbi:MAG: tetratricopeptide repeat protein, partial [Longimicrobiales bacterium]